MNSRLLQPLRSLAYLLPLALAALAVPLLAGCGAAPSGAAPSGATTPAPPPGMVRIPGGSFHMGVNDSGFDFEGPLHEVTVRPFYLDQYEVTNRQFAEFVEATGYKTVAEKWGWSAVFDRKRMEWTKTDGADWRHPHGPESSIEGKDDYPVVQVCWDDAVMYARWAKKRLPTEAEWEFAARGGLQGKTFAWGDEMNPGGKHMTNHWQGTFPKADLGEDGFKGAAPVGRFPANGYGLHDMSANVWEWVHDYFSPTYYRQSAAENPEGPTEGTERVMRGGSFLCAENYCRGYRVAARNKNTPDSASDNLGFRCAKDIP